MFDHTIGGSGSVGQGRCALAAVRDLPRLLGAGGRTSALNAREVGGAVALLFEHAFFELELLELLLGGRHGLAELEHKVYETVAVGQDA